MCLNMVFYATIFTVLMWNSLLITSDGKYNCGQSYVSRIVGGDDTTHGEFPWMAGVLNVVSFFGLFQSSHLFCGGSLINNKYVLSAAHCFVLREPPSIMVRLGAYDVDDLDNNHAVPVDVYAESIISHEGFSMDHMKYDIALLKLTEVVEFTLFIQPVCLPMPNAGDFAGWMAVVAGWGSMSYFGDMSSTLLKVEVPIVKNEACKNAYSNHNYVTINEDVICAGFEEGGKDACQGDSGGPLTVTINNKVTVIGIVSLGDGCAKPGLYGIYTRVTNYMHWIEDGLYKE